MNTPTSIESEPNDSAGFYYWQLPANEEQRLRAHDALPEEEGYLAHDVNWGRALLDVCPDPASVPSVSREWTKPATPEHLSDAISAILQVAVELGLDPELICDRALLTHRAVRKFASIAARRETNPGTAHPTDKR